MKKIEDITLADTLPNSIVKDAKVSAAATAIDPHLRLVGTKADLPLIYLKIDSLSGEMLDHLAKQYDITAWRDYWSIGVKRSVIKTAITGKRKIGTLAEVKKAIASLGSIATIKQWYETTPKGTPGTFTITVSLSDAGFATTIEAQEAVVAMLEASKPLSRHYDIILTISAKSGVNLYGCARAVIVTKMNAYAVE